ncbi:YfhO family protein [Ktedonobacter robiniae]|uniref:Membrane protein 6-pyruvoyl-tetrahydropterin synthase-related domain-containing protein n=1 Tax=Ktedonobacter robiniae TaxID=2778365 RepID=A0ABQ3UX73_9CHLR|nr:YfhO family protein [Ktedonobacter robiniae]GHO56982.1 hypothetical protein KSB_54570 [Ktedonobacter robiniae]
MIKNPPLRLQYFKRLQYSKAKLTAWLRVVGQLAILGIVAVALLLPAPFTSNQLPAARQESDLMISHWPTALLIQRTFAQYHQLPLWNPYFGGGQPLTSDPLAALFYPPTHLVHFLPLRDYYLVLILGHLLFAGLGTLLLARRTFGLSHLAALVAAIGYMATPRLISHLGAGHLTIFQTVTWFPWLALSCWATVREPRRWGALLGICIAMTLLAGHPQMAYYGMLMLAGQAAWLLVKRWCLEGRQAFLASLAGLAVAGVIGALIASIHLLPLLEFTMHSTRQTSVSSGDTYPLEVFLHELLNQQARPDLPWEGMLTPGLVVLALALLAAITRWRKAWPLLLGLVLIAGLAMGNASPLYLLAAHILPSFDRFRGLARIWFIGLFLFALLAGIGIDALLHRIRRLSSYASVATGLLAVLIVALTLVTTDSGYARSNDVGAVTRPSTLTQTATHLAGSGRIYGTQRNLPQLDAVQTQTRFADGWNPLLINSYVSYMQKAGGYTFYGYQFTIPAYDSPTVEPDARLLGLMDVSVVLSRRPLSDPHLVQVGKVDNTFLYKNTADAGYAYLVNPDSTGHLPTLNSLQPLKTPIHIVNAAPEPDTFTFSTDKPAYFVIGTPAYPGWVASLDGQSVPIQQIDGILPALKVGPGTHRVRYTYEPLSLRVGATLSLIGLLTALIWLLFVVRRSRRTQPPQPAPKQAESTPVPIGA